MKPQISNILAILGAVSVSVGVGMFRVAAGLIALGLFLILGSVATLRVEAQDNAKKRAK